MFLGSDSEKHGAKRFAKENAGTLLQFLARQLTS